MLKKNPILQCFQLPRNYLLSYFLCYKIENGHAV